MLKLNLIKIQNKKPGGLVNFLVNHKQIFNFVHMVYVLLEYFSIQYHTLNIMTN